MYDYRAYIGLSTHWPVFSCTGEVQFVDECLMFWATQQASSFVCLLGGRPRVRDITFEISDMFVSYSISLKAIKLFWNRMKLVPSYFDAYTRLMKNAEYKRSNDLQVRVVSLTLRPLQMSPQSKFKFYNVLSLHNAWQQIFLKILL